MSFGRLVLAWLPVGAWFLFARWIGERLLGGTFAADRASRLRGAAWTLAEAGVVTLFASLWFDSLGSDGWWLLFLLVGLLAAFPVRLQSLLTSGQPQRPELRRATLDTVRYVVAGAILAWRLSA